MTTSDRQQAEAHKTKLIHALFEAKSCAERIVYFSEARSVISDFIRIETEIRLLIEKVKKTGLT